VTLQTYRFSLDPTPAQERLLGSHCGAVRVASTGAWPTEGGHGAAGSRDHLRHQQRGPDSCVCAGSRG
jgi:Helix-turn-helix domain